MKLKSVNKVTRFKLWDNVSDSIYDKAKPVWYKVWSRINSENTDLQSNFVNIQRHIEIEARITVR